MSPDLRSLPPPPPFFFSIHLHCLLHGWQRLASRREAGQWWGWCVSSSSSSWRLEPRWPSCCGGTVAQQQQQKKSTNLISGYNVSFEGPAKAKGVQNEIEYNKINRILPRWGLTHTRRDGSGFVRQQSDCPVRLQPVHGLSANVWS